MRARTWWLLLASLPLSSVSSAPTALPRQSTVRNVDRTAWSLLSKLERALTHRSSRVISEEASTLQRFGTKLTVSKQEPVGDGALTHTREAQLFGAGGGLSLVQVARRRAPDAEPMTLAAWRAALSRHPSLLQLAAGMDAGVERANLVSTMVIMLVIFSVIVVVVLLTNSGAEKRSEPPSEPAPPLQFLRSGGGHAAGDVYPPLGSGMQTRTHSLVSCSLSVPSGPASSSSVVTHMRDPRWTSGDLDPRYTSSVLRRGPPDASAAPWNHP
mmetsp:Transcript_72942/g.188149  ORF Transcript_72942/g.188149 Transcript_72942/m.188149 type:complete len:270 (+) Transcript_72942:77-886(+)